MHRDIYYAHGNHIVGIVSFPSFVSPSTFAGHMIMSAVTQELGLAFHKLGFVRSA